MRLQQLTRFVERQNPSVISQRMNDDNGVGSCLDDLVEVANRAKPRRECQRAVEPDSLTAANQIPTREIARGEIVVARDGDQWLSQTPGHVFDEARLAAAGWSFQHDGELPRVAGFEHSDFV